MGGIVDAIGDVVGGVADVVGSVAEAAVDVAGSVVEAVADNPLLAVAAIATPVALSAMASSAAAGAAAGATAGAGVSASSMGLIGPTLMGAEGATAAALGSYAAATGAGAGVLGGGALSGGLTLLPAAAGSTEALGGAGSIAGTVGSTGEIGGANLSSINNALNAAVPDASVATQQGSAVLQSTGNNLAINNAATQASESIINVSPIDDIAGAVTKAKDAVDLTKAGIPVDSSVAVATNGSVTVNPLTELATSTASNVKDAWNFLSTNAQNISKTIGETVLPGADPLVQKYAGQFVVNTGTNVATGQDLQDALTSAGINIGTGIGGDYLGKQAASITGSPWAGKAASTAADIAVKGGDISDIASGVGSSLVGSGIKDITGSSLAANVGSTLANSAFTGTDPTSSLVNTGVNAVLPNNGVTNLLKPFITTGINQALAPSPTAPTSNLPTRPIPTRYVPPTKMDISQLKPINNLPRTPTTPTTPIVPTQTAVPKPAYVAPQHVDVSTLSPVTNIAGLTAILNAKKAAV